MKVFHEFEELKEAIVAAETLDLNYRIERKVVDSVHLLLGSVKKPVWAFEITNEAEREKQ